MTNPTTNEKIALALGWTRVSPAFLAMTWKAPPPDGDYSVNAPDFEHDWAHAGPLQVELWEAGFHLEHDTKDGTFYWWRPGNDGPDALDDDREDETDVKVATAMDWLAWKEEGK